VPWSSPGYAELCIAGSTPYLPLDLSAQLTCPNGAERAAQLTVGSLPADLSPEEALLQNGLSMCRIDRASGVAGYFFIDVTAEELWPDAYRGPHKISKYDAMCIAGDVESANSLYRLDRSKKRNTYIFIGMLTASVVLQVVGLAEASEPDGSLALWGVGLAIGVASFCPAYKTWDARTRYKREPPAEHAAQVLRRYNTALRDELAKRN